MDPCPDSYKLSEGKQNLDFGKIGKLKKDCGQHYPLKLKLALVVQWVRE
jgi:hypothetical protein